MDNNKILKKINKTVAMCLCSKFYADKLMNNSNTISDLREIERFPLTFKNELQEAGYEGRLSVDMKEIVEYHESFGTTGTPISTMLTVRDFKHWSDQISECAVSFNSSDVVLIRFPYAISDPAHIVQAAAKNAGACVVPVSSRTFISPHTRVINLLKKLKASVIGCMPLEAIMLAETAKQLGYKPEKDFPHLRAFCVAGELLSDERKKHIEKLWNAKVYNMYGTTETGNIASECEQGHLHISDNHFYIEILNPTDWKPVKAGEEGMLVVTTLTLEGMPLLRYVTGDMVKEISSVELSCTKKNSKVIKVLGRSTDIICLNDRDIWAVDIQDAVYSILRFEIGAFWSIGYDGIGLLIAAESKICEKTLEKNKETEIQSKLNCKLRLKLVPEGVLFDREKLLETNAVRKPEYTYVLKDYLNDEFKTLNEVLTGYHVFK